MSSLTLFLDFDGVMHADGCPDGELFAHLKNFEALLADFPSIEVVISSSWRLTQTLDEMRSRFSHAYQHRLIGVTPSIDGPNFMSREREILAWLEGHRSEEERDRWIAIDDQPAWFSPFNDRLHITDRHVGLDENSADGLRRKLHRILLESEPPVCTRSAFAYCSN